MSDFLQNFHFLRPWCLVFLLLPFFFHLKQMHFRGLISSWEKICDKNLLQFLLIKESSVRKINLKKLIYLAIVTATISAAGPSWQKTNIPTFVVENPILFTLSLSQDMQLTDLSPSRLDRAKYVISDIVSEDIKGQFGLMVYSQEPYSIVPVTDDANIIKNILPQIVPNIVPDQGDRLDRAIDLAVSQLKSSDYSYGNIIVLASDVGQSLEETIKAVKRANATHYTVNFIDTSYYGNEKIKLLSSYGDGLYLNMKNNNIQQLVSQIKKSYDNKTKLSQNLRSTYLDFGYYLVFIPLFCLLFFFRKGLIILALCCISLSAEASFLKNNNQMGLEFFKNQQYDKAFNSFTDVNWKGISLYKQEKYEDALKEFEKDKNTDALYNKGVVLVKLCKYKEALDVFNQLVEIDSKNEDALYNKKILDDLFEKSKENPDVLQCTPPQQQNQKNNQQNNESSEENKEDNQSQQNNPDEQNQNQEDEQYQNQNDEQQSEENAQEKGQKTSQDEENSKENKENQSQQNNSDEQNQQQEDSQPQNQNDEQQSDKDKNDNSPNKEQTNENPSQNNSDEKEGNKEDFEEREQQVEQAAAKQGDNNEEYNEEALAMQRRYRNIPEDVGGLLREFIKKEYLKGRYHGKN